MGRQCLFCTNSVNSKEHVWSDWILEDLKLATSVRITVGKKPSVWIDKPEIKIKCVCKTCNNEWMSDLETSNKPAIRAMMNDDSCYLTEKDQHRIALWAVMKAMVVDTVNRDRKCFYSTLERTQLRTPTSVIPVGTLVWLGRFTVKAFHAGGADVWGQIDEIPKAFQCCVTTIVVGHLVCQILSAHVLQSLPYQKIGVGCKYGAWDVNLLDIWPINGPLQWPPELSFTQKGPDSIATLVNRWKSGGNVG